MHGLEGVCDHSVTRRVAHDLESLENRHAGGEKRSERTRHLRNGSTLHERTGDRHLETHHIQEIRAALRVADNLVDYDQRTYAGGDLQTVVLHEVRNAHDELGDRRKRGVAKNVGEHLLELRDDRGKEERRDADCGKKNHGRVDHRALDLVLDLLRLFGKLGQAVQHNFEHTARLTGLHHVDIEVVEDLGIRRKRLGERSAAGDAFGDAVQARPHRRNLVLLLENLDAAHERKTGVDQRSELTSERREVFRLYASLQEGRHLDVDLDILIEGSALLRGSGGLLGRRLLACRRRSRALHLTDGAREQSRRTNRGNGLCTVRRVYGTLLLLALSIHRDVLKCRHFFPSTGCISYPSLPRLYGITPHKSSVASQLKRPISVNFA